jgi:predicted AlkP superfamily phosphohydrolase/phosphomutase/thioredoxin-like negative regulator of GroEL
MKKPRKCILVGWDGADWLIAKPLLEAGRLPHLQRIIKNGSSGDLLSMPPYISPMLWNTIATGKHPKEHGVAGFVDYNATTKKLEPFQSHQRKCKAIWNILSQQEKKAHVIGWFASHPAEKTNGVCISELFGSFPKNTKDDTPSQLGAVYPPEKKAQYDALRTTPSAVDARLLEFFIPEVAQIWKDRDQRPLKLLERLGELYSYHNAAIEIVDSEEFDFLAIYFHFIDWVCHDFIEYAAPQRPDITDRDFQLYRHVVDRAYELQDLLLGDLLSRVGPDCACMLVSDHGFASGAARPRQTPKVDLGIASWHRPQGIIAMAGPGIAQGITVRDAKLLDITPTLLYYFGLSAGKDMPGKVLADCFGLDAAPARLSSWEGMPPALEYFQSEPVAESDKDALISHFAALGYLNLEAENSSSAVFEMRSINSWNMGQALLHSRRYEEALPYLEEAYYFRPEQVHLAEPLAQCQIRLGLTEAALNTIEGLRDFAEDNAVINLKVVELYRSAGKVEAALELLETAPSLGIKENPIAFQRGLCQMQLGNFEEALEAYASIKEAKRPAVVQLAMASSLIGLKRYTEAEPLVDEVLSLTHESADAFFFKGQILAQGDDQEGAKAMFAKTLEIDPHYLLARIGLNRREREILQREGKFKPYIAEHFDFSEDEQASYHNKRDAYLAKLRDASAKRSQRWENEYRVLRAKELYGPLLQRSQKPVDESQPILIVTGLPRSGTSLMMQMLAAAGVPIKTDKQRAADHNNPKGYFEWDAIKSLRKNPRIILQAAGKAVKVVSYQLRYLPKDGHYKIIWMDRDITEITESQNQMLRGAKEAPDETPGEIDSQQLEKHRKQTLDAMEKIAEKNGTSDQILRIHYHDCVQHSRQVAEKLVAFLDLDAAHIDTIVGAVDPGLWRNRNKASTA